MDAADGARRRDVNDFLGTPNASGERARTAASQAHVDSVRASLDGRQQPFSAGWYTDHPGAWQYTHPHADMWAAASAASLTGWLGYPVVVGTPVVAPGVAVPPAAIPPAVDPNAAANAAAPPDDQEWMPLGVFATAPQGAGEAHIFQQLAVNRQGQLQGNYYDSIANAVQPLNGKIDKDTRKVAWAVGNNGAKFQTTLDDILQPNGLLTMQTGNSKQAWTLAKMDNANADK